METDGAQKEYPPPFIPPFSKELSKRFPAWEELSPGLNILPRMTCLGDPEKATLDSQGWSSRTVVQNNLD